jgi:hypothetical protein
MLCREAMQEYDAGSLPRSGAGDAAIPRPSTRIFLLTPTWTAPESASSPSALARAPGLEAVGEASGPGYAICRLSSLFPHPPIYHRVPRALLCETGKAFAAGMEALVVGGGEGEGGSAETTGPWTAALVRCVEGVEAKAGAKAPARPALASAVASLYASVRALAGAETEADQLYPIHRAAGVLFSDLSVETAREDKCLEYGCTRDAVVALSASLGGRGRGSSGASAGRAPLLLVQTDQFGICTAPSAAARAWLHEYGHDAVVGPVHVRETGRLVAADVAELAPASPAIFLSPPTPSTKREATSAS